MPTIREVCSSLSPPLRETYYFLVRYAYKTNGNVPSLRTLSRLTKLPWQTLCYRIDRLNEEGLLRKIGSGPGTRYVIVGGTFEVNFHLPACTLDGEYDACRAKRLAAEDGASSILHIR
jgi:hypothetical protein